MVSALFCNIHTGTQLYGNREFEETYTIYRNWEFGGTQEHTEINDTQVCTESLEVDQIICANIRESFKNFKLYTT